MACSSPASADLSQCPCCQALCLSPTILPCGHVVCRKCVRTLLEDKPQCPVCRWRVLRRTGETAEDVARRLEQDLVLNDLVLEELSRQGDLFCHICPNKSASSVCADCGEMYCSTCAVVHRKQRMSKDHVQHDIITSDINSSQDSIRYEQDPRPRQHTDKERLRQEARLVREAVSRLQDAASTVRDNVAQLQQLESSLERQQRLLTAYLPRLVTPDDAMLTKAGVMLSRLEVLRQDCGPPPPASLTRLTQHVNTLLQHGTTAGAMSYDPMICIPTRKFAFTPDADGDTHREGPWINSIVATDDGRLVMTDNSNKMVKVARLDDPANTVEGVAVDTTPYGLAYLHDGQVAVTAGGKRIYFVDVTGTPTVVSRVQTTRQYSGVGCVMESDTLVAGSRKADDDGPATVDVLNRAGAVLRSVIDSSTLTTLSWPHYLHVQNQTVWVSDWDASAVFRVELDTGRVVSKYTHTDLENPCQVAVDRAGHCYIASAGGKCVLVVSPGGQWRRLLTKSEHGDRQRPGLRALCVTEWGLAVTWDGMDFTAERLIEQLVLRRTMLRLVIGTLGFFDHGSIVVGYKLK